MTDYMESRLTFTEAAQRLRDGEVIAYPTEAVWGLGADPLNESAVLRLLALKQRPPEKGLILAAGTRQQVEPFLALLNDAQRERVLATWPGPYTWLFPRPDVIPDWICGTHQSVAVRWSAHPTVMQLCQAFGGLVVSTSANPAGVQAARSAGEVRHFFGDDLPLVAGELGSARMPTQIGDAQTGAILRPSSP